MIITTCKNNATIKETWRFIAGLSLLFSCSQIYIPLHPIPISLQTVAVMIVALLYSMREGLQIMVSYVIAGSLGAPVFAGYSAGPHVLFGATGGYLIGFILCIYCMNVLKNILDLKSNMGIFLNCIIGMAVIFTAGISWLALGINLGWKMAINVGLLPFVIPGAIKAIALSVFLQSLNLLGRK